MNWSNQWSASDPRDAMSRDELLMRHQEIKNKLEQLKAEEMEYRKYIVKRAFPDKKEGVNTLELGNGYELKSTIKYNYNLISSVDIIEKTLDRIAKVGNRGMIVSERLVSWKPSFMLTEWRLLQEEVKEGSRDATIILGIINESKILEITDAAPTLDIKEPKKKK